MRNTAHEKCLPLSFDGLSKWHSARMSRCLAVRMCEEPSSEKLIVSQQHIPQDLVTVDHIPNRKSVLHYCQLCNIFPILCSFNRSKMFCNSSFSWTWCVRQGPGFSLCLKRLSWLQDVRHHHFTTMYLRQTEKAWGKLLRWNRMRVDWNQWTVEDVFCCFSSPSIFLRIHGEKFSLFWLVNESNHSRKCPRADF